MKTILDAIDEKLAGRHLLTHPFYLAWTRGELSRETLAALAVATLRNRQQAATVA